MAWSNQNLINNLLNIRLEPGAQKILIDYFRTSKRPYKKTTRKSLMPKLDEACISQAMPYFSEEDFSYNNDIYSNNLVLIDPKPDKSQLGIVGFDLRQGRLIAECDTVMDNIEKKDLLKMPHKILEPGEPYIFYPDPDGEKVYYSTTFEKIGLSKDLELLIDSKSTTGRVGCLTHYAGSTENGELISIIQPFSFPLKVTCGKTCLSQAAIRYKNSPYMTNEEILKSNEVNFLGLSSLKEALNSNGLKMSFKTNKAYRAKPYNKDMAPIDMDEKASLDYKDYFDLIVGNHEIYTDKKTLYLLGSQGTIILKKAFGILSREQGVLTGTGAWSHLAGFFQPFWQGEITMEFYSHEKRRIRNGSGAGYVKFDSIEGKFEEPEKKGNYQNQSNTPTLPKMFKID
jgi:deoxycytidine triphosphate deaminase